MGKTPCMKVVLGYIKQILIIFLASCTIIQVIGLISMRLNSGIPDICIIF